jgi:hypothetical protein
MSNSAAVEIMPADPLQYGVPLPLSLMVYPIGYPVRIETNSMDVVRAADEAWGLFPCLHQTPPVQVRFIVSDSDRPAGRVAPSCRGQGHLIAYTMGPDDHAIADIAAGFVLGWLTPASVADRSGFRYFILEPLIYLTLQCLYCLPVHAAAIAREGRALLLCGDSGTGKTCLAYACARRGWTYLADDATAIHRDRAELVATGKPHQVRFRSSASAIFPELAQFAPVERPNGKPDIEVDSAALRLVSIALEAPVAGLVFLKHEKSYSPASLHPYAQSDALDYLQQIICFGDDQVRREMRHCVARLVELPMVELRYSLFDDAEQRLRVYIEGSL